MAGQAQECLRSAPKLQHSLFPVLRTFFHSPASVLQPVKYQERTARVATRTTFLLIFPLVSGYSYFDLSRRRIRTRNCPICDDSEGILE